mmetsp:Transcript_33304/g.81790  ORF Transcript_33304/g.81790 Transcript_33304/m.81790 type:complete len:340 (-) Transcript_33304:403-1422(-)
MLPCDSLDILCLVARPDTKHLGDEEVLKEDVLASPLDTTQDDGHLGPLSWVPHKVRKPCQQVLGGLGVQIHILPVVQQLLEVLHQWPDQRLNCLISSKIQLQALCPEALPGVEHLAIRDLPGWITHNPIICLDVWVFKPAPREPSPLPLLCPVVQVGKQPPNVCRSMDVKGLDPFVLEELVVQWPKPQTGLHPDQEVVICRDTNEATSPPHELAPPQLHALLHVRPAPHHIHHCLTQPAPVLLCCVIQDTLELLQGMGDSPIIRIGPEPEAGEVVLVQPMENLWFEFGILCSLIKHLTAPCPVPIPSHLFEERHRAPPLGATSFGEGTYELAEGPSVRA